MVMLDTYDDFSGIGHKSDWRHKCTLSLISARLNLSLSHVLSLFYISLPFSLLLSMPGPSGPPLFVIALTRKLSSSLKMLIAKMFLKVGLKSLYLSLSLSVHFVFIFNFLFISGKPRAYYIINFVKVNHFDAE